MSEVAGAFGRGFVSGASGTLAGIGIGIATGNPFAAGAAGGAVSSIVDQGISGKFNRDNFLVSTMTGAIAGPLASKLLPTVGRLPNLLTPRNAGNFGKDSMRLTGQESLSGTVGGVVGSVTSGKLGK